MTNDIQTQINTLRQLGPATGAVIVDPDIPKAMVKIGQRYRCPGTGWEFEIVGFARDGMLIVRRDGGDRWEWSGEHVLAYCELVPGVAPDRLAEIHGKHTDWLATTGRSAALAAAWSLYPARYEPRDDARAEELARRYLDGMGRGLASLSGFRTSADDAGAFKPERWVRSLVDAVYEAIGLKRIGEPKLLDIDLTRPEPDGGKGRTSGAREDASDEASGDRARGSGAWPRMAVKGAKVMP